MTGLWALEGRITVCQNCGLVGCQHASDVALPSLLGSITVRVASWNDPIHPVPNVVDVLTISDKYINSILLGGYPGLHPCCIDQLRKNVADNIVEVVPITEMLSLHMAATTAAFPKVDLRCCIRKEDISWV